LSGQPPSHARFIIRGFSRSTPPKTLATWGGGICWQSRAETQNLTQTLWVLPFKCPSRGRSADCSPVPSEWKVGYSLGSCLALGPSSLFGSVSPVHAFDACYSRQEMPAVALTDLSMALLGTLYIARKIW